MFSSACRGSMLAMSRGGGWSPSRFFASGSQGAWYDPSDFSTLYQDSAGTTPVTAVGQAVGLLLDKSQGLQARRNRLTYSSQFSNAAWVRSNLTSITAKADGIGDLLIANASAGNHYVEQANIASVGVINAVTVRAKAGGWNFIAIVLASGATYFNVSTGTIGNVQPGATASISLADGAAGAAGYYDCTIAYAGHVNGNAFIYAVNANGNAGAAAGDGVTTGVYLARAQLEWNTTTPSAYQDVTSGAGGWTPGNHSSQATTTSRPTLQQPSLYDVIRSDGVDDNLASTTGGGGTAGLLICAAITVNGGAGTARTIWSDAGTNTGYRLRINASNQLELAAGNGTAFTTIATTATLPVAETHVVTAWDDGSNLNVQVDNGTVASVARPVVSAGTAGFTKFKDNGAASSFLSCDEQQFVYVQGTAKTTNDRTLLKRYVGAKAGLSL